MRQGKQLAGLVLALALGAGVSWQARRHVQPPPPLAIPVSARAAMQDLLALTLEDHRGQPQKLAQWHGQPMLINFWATWCAPCREEMPLLDKIARKYAGKVQVLGIAVDRAANVADHARAHPAAYPLLVGDAQSSALQPALGNPAQGVPFSLLVTASGEVVSLRLGAFLPGELEALLERHSVANGSKMK